DVVTALSPDPECIPLDASGVLVAGLTDCNASGKGSGMPVPSNVSRCGAPSNEYWTPKVIPPATDMLTPVLMLYPGDVPVWTARPEAVIKSVTCRPLSGKSSMRWVSKTRATPELRVST